MVDRADERQSQIAGVARRVHHRMVGVTLKTALAAGIAWQLAVILPGYLPEYAFYGPMGALTVMYSAIYDSVVEGLRAVAAVSLGVLVSVLVHLVAGPTAFTVAIAIGAGTLLSCVPKLGEQRSWVPIAALFVFTAGRADPLPYLVGYLCDLSLGVVVGLLVNCLVFPPLALHEAERATGAVRREIVRVLSALIALADATDDTVDDRAGAVYRALGRLPDAHARLRKALDQAGRARRGNPRARWRRADRDGVLSLAAASERAAGLVEDLAHEMLESRVTLIGVDRSPLVRAIGGLRDVIAQSRHGVPDPDLVAHASELLDDATRSETPYVVRQKAENLRRCLRIATEWDME